MQNIQSNFDNPQSLQNYYAAQNIINNFVAQMYSKALEEGVDPNTIDPLAQILQGEAERYKPIPPQFQEFDPKSGERQYNPATNTWDVIRRNKQMTKSTSNASESKKETNDPLGIR
jgi:hypothetical protein